MFSREISENKTNTVTQVSNMNTVCPAETGGILDVAIPGFSNGSNPLTIMVMYKIWASRGCQAMGVKIAAATETNARPD